MINNYKAQRNVRAELGGVAYLGKPVSLYIKEDELKYSSKNLATNGKFQDGTTAPFANTDMDEFGLATNPVSGRTSLRVVVGDADDVAQGDFNVSVGKTYKISFNRTIPNHDSNSTCKFKFGNLSTGTLYGEIRAYTSNTTTGVFRESFIFTASDALFRFRIAESGNDNDAEIFIDDIQLYEVVDHTYKLMAIIDTIPSGGVNAEAVGSDIITNGGFFDTDNWSLGTGWAIGSGKATCSSGNSNLTQNIDITAGRTYRVTFEIEDYTSGGVVVDIGRGTASALQSGNGAKSVDIVAGSGVEDIRFYGGAFRGAVDDVVVKELYGYDYYNAPAYKFGIVSSVYDQSTGAMKTTGVAGDEVDVTVQGECNLRGPSGSATKDKLISKILINGDPTDVFAADAPLPNAVGVITETVSGDTTFPIILFQGVEFSEHFVHKNSLQVMAKCDETITKFRPVALFLDSEGDLLCRHDKIPAELPDANTDHTGVDPGKWGVAELGGVSGDIIPVTVAGKTHINTPSTVTSGKIIRQVLEAGNIYSTTPGASSLPGGIGTIMEDGTGDVPITIFQGTPIGTITDWKRTIKVTAKANGAITQYCPVSLYLDQYGNYKCISDNIPIEDTDTSNGIWVDFRKWGIAQETVADGENVEIIVQGRTKVNNVKDSCNRQDYVKRITSNGTVVGTSSNGYQLSMLGIVEKESKTSDGEPGTIIIF